MATIWQAISRYADPPVETQPGRTVPRLPLRSVSYAVRVLLGSVVFDTHEIFKSTADSNRLFGLVV
jgi:hypothetical protein